VCSAFSLALVLLPTTPTTTFYRVIFRVTLRRSAGVNLGTLAYLPACDGEVILLPRVPFVVTNPPHVDQADGYTYVDLREVVV
jgi:hypothetical protein